MWPFQGNAFNSQGLFLLQSFQQPQAQQLIRNPHPLLDINCFTQQQPHFQTIGAGFAPPCPPAQLVRPQCYNTLSDLKRSYSQAHQTENFYNRFYALSGNRSRSPSPVCNANIQQTVSSQRSYSHTVTKTTKQKNEEEKGVVNIKPREKRNSRDYVDEPSVKRKHLSPQTESQDGNIEAVEIGDDHISDNESDEVRETVDDMNAASNVSSSPRQDFGEDGEDSQEPSGSSGWQRKKRKPRKKRRCTKRKWNFTEYGNNYLSNRGMLREAKKGNSLDFVLVSYNVLSQDLLEGNSFLYSHCANKPEVLEWDYRWRNLRNEFRLMNADILCLQEVNAEHFSTHFLPYLRQLGYDGVYKKRSGGKKDGCATFFKQSTFILEKHVPVEYLQSDVPLLDRDNVGLVTLFKVKVPYWERKLCVANTHLLFNPKRGDVKLAQLALLLGETDRLAHIRENKDFWPVIFCGDLNLEPESDIHRFLTDGFLRYEGLVISQLSGQTQRGTQKQMQRGLFPKSFGMTDGCQWLNELELRASEMKKKKRTDKFKSSSGVQSDKSAAASSSAAANSVTDQASSSDQPHFENDGKDTWCQAQEVFDGSVLCQNSGVLTNRFNLTSTHKYFKEVDGNIYSEVTTFHGKANCTVDHILYSRQGKKMSPQGVVVPHEKRLHLVGRLLPFTSEEAEAVTGKIPNKTISSDHYPLHARFVYKLKH